MERSETRVRVGPDRGGINLRELWEYRELLFFLVWRDIKVRYKQTLIGVAWAVIQPFFAMVVFSLFFGMLAKIPSDDLPYPIFYYSALLPWTYFASALQNATNVVVDHQRVVTKVYFPRLLLPAAAVLPGLLDLTIAFGVLGGIMVWYRVVPPATAALAPLFILLALLTALAVGLWLSALNALYRDVRYAVPLLIQLWLFASPVVYPTSLVPTEWRWVYGVNPMAGVIEGFRWSLTGSGQGPDAMLVVSTAVVVALLIGGLWFFRRVEGTMTDVL